MNRRIMALLAAVLLGVSAVGCSSETTTTTGAAMVPSTSAAPETTQPVETTTTAATTTTTTTVARQNPEPTPLEDPPTGLEMVVETPVVIPDAKIVSVVESDSGYLAVGAVLDSKGFYGDAAVWLSTDARTWERVPDEGDVFNGKPDRPTDGDQWIAEVIEWEGTLVAVGSDGGGQNTEYDPAVWVSEDGRSWSRVRSPDFEAPGTAWATSIVQAGGGLVAVGQEAAGTNLSATAAVWRSEDALNWSAVDLDAIESDGSSSLNDVAVGGPGLVAVGMIRQGHWYGWPWGEPAVWTSTDGNAWELIELDPGVRGGENRTVVRSVEAGPDGRLAAVGCITWLKPDDIDRIHAAVWLSDDGSTWELAAVLDDPEYQTCAGSARWQDDTLLVIGTGYDILLSGYMEDTQDGFVMEVDSKDVIAWATTDFGETWHRVARGAVDAPIDSQDQRSWVWWAPGFSLDASHLASNAAFGEDGLVIVGLDGNVSLMSQADG